MSDYPSATTPTDYAEFAQWQLRNGGVESTTQEAEEMASIRRKVGGYFPVVYPIVGGTYIVYDE